jgi:hypothetical protein
MARTTQQRQKQVNARIEILTEWQKYVKSGKPEPTTLKLSLLKAYDLCKLGRDELGKLSQHLLIYGPHYLEKSGFYGLRVVITTPGNKDIEFE